jgi:translocation and assembly module TamA
MLRMRRHWPWLLLALALYPACAGRPMSHAVVVDDLEIRGNQVLSETEIKKRILTSETRWWPLAKKSAFDPVEWQSDLARIERLYQARGYYQAQVVKADIKLDPKRGARRHDRVDLLVEVQENGPVRINDVQVAGIDPLTTEERASLLEELPLRKEEVFRENDWERAKSLMLRQLRDAGYARAQVAGQAAVDVGTSQADLTLRAAPGRRYHFGDVRVDDGQRSTIEAAWVAEQARLAIGEGQLYSENALDEAQTRVFAMGVFSTVRVDTAAEPTPDGRLPVMVHVRPGPLRSLRLGGGVGFDQVRQEARLLGDWTHRNFLGGLRRLHTQAMAGWAFLPSTLAVVRSRIDQGPRHGFIYRATGNFDQPRLGGRPSLRLQSLLESERTLEQTYDAIGGRTMLGVRWEPHSTVSLLPAYNLQGYWLNGPSTATAQSAPLALGCQRDPCFVLLSYLEQTVTWDTRDDPLEPRKGRYLALSLQEGGGPLGGTFDYLRILPEARGYLSLGDDDQITLAARVRVGSLITRSGRPEDSAVVTRFYSGGSMWMRGFSVRRLSPMILIPTPGSDDPESKLALPIGGNGLVEGNFEVRSRFSDTLAAAAFVDYGQVTRARIPLGQLPNLLYAAGFGIRYLTPVGPLRADLGFRLPFGRPPPLYDSDGSEITYRRLAGGMTEPGTETGLNVNDSCFGIGGNGANSWVRDGLCSFHISIGEAF